MDVDDFMPAAEPAPPVTAKQVGKILAIFREAGYLPEHRDKRLAVMSKHTGREITSTNQLTKWEASDIAELFRDLHAECAGPPTRPTEAVDGCGQLTPADAAAASCESMEITTVPARWPFCEARARAAAAWVAYPEPPKNVTRRRRSGVSPVELAEQRRHTQRLASGAA